ncbi:MAG: MerR family transcriptional regulator [Pseudomonadota bacterium]
MAGKKSPDAFRTISEVAAWLDVNAHVLRFWESKFSQIKPVKRAGGRRYYRPSDMELLGGIKQLLHEDGLTIKGAQKVLREQGVKAVAALSKPVDDHAPEAEAADLTPAGEAPAGEAPSGEALVGPDAAPHRAPAEATADHREDSPAPDASVLDFDAMPEAAPTPEAAPADDAAAIPEVAFAPEADAPPEPGPPPPAEPQAQPTLFDPPPEPRRDAPQVEIAPLPALPSEIEASAPPPADAPPVPAPDESPAERVFDRDPTAAAPEIAPLPGIDLALTEALDRLAPGQLPTAELVPILERAKALRARMDARGGL